MTISENSSVFHAGERAVQARTGVRDLAERLGGRFIRTYLTAEHREFYQNLSFVFIGSSDESGHPWASILFGRPGFLSTPSDSTLRVQARPLLGDPLEKSLSIGTRLGFLGIEYDTRRRNRMTGRITAIGKDYFEVKVDQSFGNCPQYIQSRDYEFIPDTERIANSESPLELSSLNGRATQIISEADNFYIASYYSPSEEDKRQGADVSHRGGKPGFVKIVDENTLMFPDFSGNNHFNTLGNIELNPVAGLLFIDFSSSDLLYLTGTVKVHWKGDVVSQFKGAKSIIELSITSGYLLQAALPMRWSFYSYSPSLEQTGLWADFENVAIKEPLAQHYQDFIVYHIEDESDIIRSFYLKPAVGTVLPSHKAGQHLPIEVQLRGESAPLRRTYTISNAPNGEFLRLSIKKEPSSKLGLPPGVVSNYFHNHVTQGSIIRAAHPQGNFVLDRDSTRPVVLLGGGVGVTPLISMLQQLLRDTDQGKSARDIWFIYSARNSSLQAFREYLQAMYQRHSNLHLYTVYSNPLLTDQVGVQFDGTGYVSIELLKKLLPLDDYEYYYCGPQSFMESLKLGFESLNIREERTHSESFGAPRAELQIDDSHLDQSNLKTSKVIFSRSGVEAEWHPTRGSLLELAEDEGINPLYSCRSGFCQTCITPLISGEIDYIQSPAIEPPIGSALLCCAVPRTGTTEAPSEHLVLDL